MTLHYTVRPISDPTWFGTMGKEPTRFQAKWGATLELLEREIGFLKGRDVVIECDVREQDLRLDGTLRANARPSSPGVVVAFESKHGPLLYRCDRFYTSWAHQGESWHHNVRAIALTLEALRAVDRYGATETGQQYAGFKQLPAGRAMPASHMTRDAALGALSQLLEGDLLPDQIAAAIARHEWAPIRNRLLRVAHPDRRDGDHAAWRLYQEACDVLGVSS